MMIRQRKLAIGLALIACWLGAAAPAAAQQAGRDPVLGQPSAGGVTVIDLSRPVTSSGILRVWRAASTDGARVMLKVYRPDGSRLVLVGTSPLETVAAGEIATFSCAIPVARNDVIGCSCPDSSCVDRFADGDVLSAAGDLGTSDRLAYDPGTGSPAIFASGSRLATVPSTAATDLVLPVVARTPGLNGTVWSTSLELHNPADRPAEVSLFFNRSDQNNTAPAASAQAVVEAGGTMRWDDLLAEAFELAEDVGSVDVLATEPVIAHARIANYGGSAGSYGQAVPAVPGSWALGEDPVPGTDPDAAVARLFECREGVEFRCNLGIASVDSAPVTVEVSAWSGPDPVGTPLVVELAPFSHTQINRVLQQIGIAPAVGVRLAVAPAPGTRGRFFAYLSNVDNLSGDAVFLLGDRVATLP